MAPATKETLTEVKERLDQLLLQLMDDLEALKVKREQLNSLIEKGWFCLSQSRYSMGNKFVSSLQYEQDMVPSVCVQGSTSEDGVTVFQVENIESGHGESGKSEEMREVETVGAGDQVLRLRGHKSTTETPKHPKTEGSQKPRPPPSNDPLRWFGVLVPQSLRQAQSTFRQGILLAAEVASLQSNIDETRKQYRALLTDKHRLQSQPVCA
ncbi:PREDICTED: coiled-coil domain-containing protein 115 [Nanorana parkeri]|uniref:coiled-coil domain-containing protein 115 n=1 Tax=Nanorana parkeri TaxID=125878 RepID=UPI000854960C|nr:PREDICTED: coiled-coil domain-containing protein 115 [Nanorana parkeri]